MTDAEDAPPTELVLQRTLHAPIERVWDAWTTRSGLEAWWWSHWADVEITVDARVDGAYRFAAPHAGLRVSGVFAQVERPRLLAFTWEWEDADGIQPEEHVVVELDVDADGTRLTLRHTGPWHDAAPARDYAEGWGFVLAALEAMVTAV
jgi:uncharacterized protein YndB with AHSA1/START domain